MSVSIRRGANIHLHTRPRFFYLSQIDRDKLSVRYRGNSNHNADWGSVRANHPLPKRRRMFYFEVTVVSAGEQASITVGLVNESFRMTMQPGTQVRTCCQRREEEETSGVVW